MPGRLSAIDLLRGGDVDARGPGTRTGTSARRVASSASSARSAPRRGMPSSGESAAAVAGRIRDLGAGRRRRSGPRRCAPAARRAVVDGAARGRQVDRAEPVWPGRRRRTPGRRRSAARTSRMPMVVNSTSASSGAQPQPAPRVGQPGRARRRGPRWPAGAGRPAPVAGRRGGAPDRAGRRLGTCRWPRRSGRTGGVRRAGGGGDRPPRTWRRALVACYRTARSAASCGPRRAPCGRAACSGAPRTAHSASVDAPARPGLAPVPRPESAPPRLDVAPVPRRRSHRPGRTPPRPAPRPGWRPGRRGLVRRLVPRAACLTYRPASLACRLLTQGSPAAGCGTPITRPSGSRMNAGAPAGTRPSLLAAAARLPGASLVGQPLLQLGCRWSRTACCSRRSLQPERVLVDLGVEHQDAQHATTTTSTRTSATKGARGTRPAAAARPAGAVRPAGRSGDRSGAGRLRHWLQGRAALGGKSGPRRAPTAQNAVSLVRRSCRTPVDVRADTAPHRPRCTCHAHVPSPRVCRPGAVRQPGWCRPLIRRGRSRSARSRSCVCPVDVFARRAAAPRRPAGSPPPRPRRGCSAPRVSSRSVGPVPGSSTGRSTGARAARPRGERLLDDPVLQRVVGQHHHAAHRAPARPARPAAPPPARPARRSPRCAAPGTCASPGARRYAGPAPGSRPGPARPAGPTR